jgi:hypothetical protein
MELVMSSGRLTQAVLSGAGKSDGVEPAAIMPLDSVGIWASLESGGVGSAARALVVHTIWVAINRMTLRMV